MIKDKISIRLIDEQREAQNVCENEIRIEFSILCDELDLIFKFHFISNCHKFIFIFIDSSLLLLICCGRGGRGSVSWKMRIICQKK